MSKFEQRYRSAFAELGRPLRRSDAIPSRRVAVAERRCGVLLPTALHEFFRVAGRARDVMNAHEQLMMPEEWLVEYGKLVFMAENQEVVVYGVNARRARASDAPVYMAVSHDGPLIWHRVCDRASSFMEVMVAWQAVCGGFMSHGGTALASRSTRARLESSWHYLGEVNKLRAYRRSGEVACYLPWGRRMQVMVAATSAARYIAVGKELGLKWPDQQVPGRAG